MAQLRERVFANAQVQAVYMDSLLTVMAGPDRPSRCPRNFQDGKLVTSDIDWWCSGFYPGVLWQIYGETADTLFRQLAEKHTLPLAELLNHKTDHDIGFQLMCSFGKMVKDCHFERSREISPEAVLAHGADKLAARFVPEAGVIRSWNWGA